MAELFIESLNKFFMGSSLLLKLFTCSTFICIICLWSSNVQCSENWHILRSLISHLQTRRKQFELTRLWGLLLLYNGCGTDLWGLAGWIPSEETGATAYVWFDFSVNIRNYLWIICQPVFLGFNQFTVPLPTYVFYLDIYSQYF